MEHQLSQRAYRICGTDGSFRSRGRWHCSWQQLPLSRRPQNPVGCATPGLDPFDAAMTQLLHEWNLPGGSLAVSHNGHILLMRGYGFANKETNAPVTPRTRFRLGSLAKPITAVAVLTLIEEGRLGLDDKILPLLGELSPAPAAIRDPRIYNITVRHLLQHSGGFDRKTSGDPVFMPYAGTAMARQNAKPPPTCQVVLSNASEHSSISTRAPVRPIPILGTASWAELSSALQGLRTPTLCTGAYLNRRVLRDQSSAVQ